MKTILNIVVLLCVFSSNIIAEEELKSQEKIFKESDVCFSGVVKSVKVFKKIDEFSSIYSADIVVTNFLKGLFSERRSKEIKVYYRNATKKGVFEEHSPSLAKGQKVKIMAFFKRGIHKEGYSIWISSKNNISLLPE